MANSFPTHLIPRISGVHASKYFYTYLGETMLRRIVLLSLSLLCLLGGFSSAVGAAPQKVSKVIFLPFDTSAAGKFAPLEPGLQNMLISRLAERDRIEIIDYSLKKSEITKLKRSVKKGEETSIFSKLQTDYIVSGALYAVDDGLQVQVIFHPGNKENAAADLTIFAESENRIIFAMNQLSQKIAEKVFGYESVQEEQESQESIAGAEGFSTAHPDRAYKKGAYLSDSEEGGGQLLLAKGIRKSAKIPMKMVSMASGDLDGDGQNEILLGGSGELKIFQFVGGVFKKVDTVSLSASLKIHAINVADLDNDKSMEVYISANSGYLASSLILQWKKGSGGTVIMDKIPWYIRPLNYPGEGEILIGQNRGLDTSTAVEPGIFKLIRSRDGKKLIQRDSLPIPQSVNLFDFIFADLDNDGTIEKIVLSPSEKLLVYDNENRIKWVSSGDYGGSKNHFGPYLSDADDSGLFNSIGKTESDERVLTFIPTRMIAADADGDGKTEIIVGSNILTTYRFMENFRSYEGGTISCLSWNGTKMIELWKTNNINGYIADYSFGTIPVEMDVKPGQTTTKKQEKSIRNRLIVGHIPDRGMYDYLTFAGDESRLLAYEMDLLDKSTEK